MSDNMFEKASRKKLRFPHRGICTVEDLWDLSVEHLDKIYAKLKATQKAGEGESLLRRKSKESDDNDLAIDIVKYIVGVKLAEIDERTQAKSEKARKQKIMDIIQTKEDAELAEMSVDDLKKML